MTTAKKLRRILDVPLRVVTFVILFPQRVLAQGTSEDFSNNLFSDLAPVLTLFGEQVAKQFMSESLGWADNILFAMGPLGIITAVVGAIRVSGPTWLKAIIGRAREGQAAAEVELMSSTSHDVCELFNGQSIVRLMGSSSVQELIYIRDLRNATETGIDGVTKGTYGLYTLESMKNKMFFPDNQKFAQSLRKSMHGSVSPPDEEPGKPEPQPQGPKPVGSHRLGIRNHSAPNISLNTPPHRNRWEVRMAAAFGVVLQLGVLVFSGFAARHSALKFEKGGAPIADYAFPLTAIGTITLVTGMLICSSVVERSTEEEVWVTKPQLKKTAMNSAPEEQKGELVGPEVQILWLQRGQPVNDQLFDSFAIFAEGKRHEILTSRRAQQGPSNPKHGDSGPTRYIKERIPSISMYLAVLGTLVSVAGFILQFTGLRAMHWSATIAQLTATLIMTVLRAWIRRGLASHPPFQQVPDQFEMEWLATRITIDSRYLWGSCGFVAPDGFWNEECWKWNIDGVDKMKCKVSRDPKIWLALSTGAQRAVKVRERLGGLSKWTGPASELAVSVASAIEAVINQLTLSFRLERTNKFALSITTWAHNTHAEEIYFVVQRRCKGQPWKVDSTEIEAFLSLWLFSVHKRDNAIYAKNISNQSDWLRQGNLGLSKRSLRLLGPNKDIFCRDLKWWMNDKTFSIFEADYLDQIGHEASLELGNLSEVVEVDQHRILGRNDLHLLKEDPFVSSKWGCRKMVFYKHPILHYRQPIPQKLPQKLPQLAAISNLPLANAFAQDLFSSFVYAISDAAYPIPGDVMVHRIGGDNTYNTWDYFKLENSTLLKIVQGIKESGLATSEEALMSIIPPFSINALLPDSSVIIQTAQDYANDLIKRGSLCEAGAVYLELTQVFQARSGKNLCPRRGAFEKAVVLLSEFRIMSHILKMLWAVRAEIKEMPYNLYPTKDDTPKIRGSDSDQNIIWQLYQRLGLVGCRTSSGTEGLIELYWPAPKDHLLSEDFKKGIMESKFLDITPSHISAIIGLDCATSVASQSDDWFRKADIIGRTPLHYIAASSGQMQARTRRIYHILGPTDVNAEDISGWTPLHYCAWNGNLEALKFLLDRSAVVEKVGIAGITPLHCAAQQGHCEIAKLLLKAGATPNAVGTMGITPLHCACRQGFSDIVLALLDGNAALNTSTSMGESAMHIAAEAGNIEILEILIEKGALKDMKDQFSMTPLHYAAKWDEKEAVKLLVGAGSDEEARDYAKRTPLGIAATSGAIKTVEWFLDRGAPLETKPHTLLNLATKGKQKEMMKLLLARGAQIDAPSEFSETALHTAAMAKDEELVKLLLENGAQTNVTCCYGDTPLHYTATVGDNTIAELLLAGGAQIDAMDLDRATPLHYAAVFGEKETMELFLARGAQINATNEDKETPLHLAAAAGWKESVRFLVEMGAQVDAVSQCWGMPIHCAAAGDDEESMTLFLARGVPINTVDQYGRTPLHYAATFGHEGVTRFLLERGAQVDAINQNQETPLHLAAAACQKGVVELLLAGGARTDAKDRNGEAPLHLAMASNVTRWMKRWLAKEDPNKMLRGLTLNSGKAGVTEILREREESSRRTFGGKRNTERFQRELLIFLLRSGADVDPDLVTEEK